jgi:LPXTG-motif cell wall-anchored protein
MNRLRNIPAVCVILAGLVWFLQGIGTLPGSFMSNSPQWAVYGGMAMLAGAGYLYFANRKKK